MPDRLITGDRDAADRNASLLSWWLSNGWTVRAPGGDVWLTEVMIGADGKPVAFDLRGNGGCRFGGDYGNENGPTRFRPAERGMSALFTVGGSGSGGHKSGRAWRIRDCAFCEFEDYKHYNATAHAIAVYQGSGYSIERCSFIGWNVGIKLSAERRLFVGEIANCSFKRDTCAILADGHHRKSTHGSLDIRTCESDSDLTGFFFSDWWSGGSITNCGVHKSRNACVRCDRSTVLLTGVYAEGGGEHAISTLVFNDSRVGGRGVNAPYLQISPDSTFHLDPPGRIDQCPNDIVPAVYGRTDSKVDPREIPGGFTVYPGSTFIENGVVFKCTEGGWAKGSKAKWARVGVVTP